MKPPAKDLAKLAKDFRLGDADGFGQEVCRLAFAYDLARAGIADAPALARALRQHGKASAGLVRELEGLELGTRKRRRGPPKDEALHRLVDGLAFIWMDRREVTVPYADARLTRWYDKETGEPNTAMEYMAAAVGLIDPAAAKKVDNVVRQLVARWRRMA